MIKAHIAEGPFGDFLKVFIVDHYGQGKRLLHYEGDHYRWEEIPQDEAIADPRPTVELPWDSGRALLEALMRHYNGAEDTRQLRKDYDAERRRVDEQHKVIAGIAQALVERAR